MSARSMIAIASLMLASACVVAGQTSDATPVAAPAAAPAAGDDGQALYARHCLTCHQADGYGVPNMQPAITGGTWVGGEPRALAMFVMTGGFDSASRKDSDNHNVMPAFAQLSDAELAAVLTFIRAKFGKGASAVSAADVAAARSSLPK
jgi:mono/diheme cytochrome c family protein